VLILAAADLTAPEWVAVLVAALGGGEGLRRAIVWGRRVILAAAKIMDAAEQVLTQAEQVSQFAAAFERLTILEAYRAADDAAEGVAKIAWDAQGQCCYVCLEWQSLTGMGMEDARGSGWLDCIHPDDRTRVRQLWDAFLAGARRRFAVEDFRIQRPDGSLIRCRMRAGRGYSRDREQTLLTGRTYRLLDLGERS
jgi:PAS domain S-box-containing protein